MYYQNYEDYMRRVLGYPQENSYYNSFMPQERTYSTSIQMMDMGEINNLYPNICMILNPIIDEVCNNYPIGGKITNEMLDNMVERVCQNIESNREINVNIFTENENRNIETPNIYSEKDRVSKQQRNMTEIRKTEDRQTTAVRPSNNRFLRDLIRLLLLERIFGGIFQRRPNRPPFPIRPRIIEDRDYQDFIKF